MRVIFVLLDFIGLSYADKIAFYRNVLIMMRKNVAVFANPDKDLNAVEALINDFESKFLTPTIGGHPGTVILHKAEVAADAAFRILAAYVNRIANGDEAIIMLSGFNASSEPEHQQKEVLAVTDGPLSGSAKCIALAVLTAGAYIWQHFVGASVSDDTVWETFSHTTQADTIDNGQTVGSKVWYRVAAITTTGVTDFSAPVMKVIQ